MKNCSICYKLLTVLAILMMALSLYAQQGSAPFLQEGKKWNYCYPVEADFWGSFSLTVAGDTVVGQYTCKKIVRTYWLTRKSLEALLYEEGTKVYEVTTAAGDANLRLLYDFSLKKGSKTRDEETGTVFMVTGIDTVSCMGHRYQRQRLTADDFQTEWIAGIGGTKGLLYPLVSPDDDYTRLISCEEGGKVVFVTQEATASTQADSYIPLVEEGKTWVYNEAASAARDISYRISGDTLIGGKAYKKLYEKQGLNGEYKYYGALREPDRRVYLLMAGELKEHLLYDFYLSVNYDECEDETGMVSQVACIMPLRSSEGRLLRERDMKCYRPNQPQPMMTGLMPWIEGVGAKDRLPFQKAAYTGAKLQGCYNKDSVCICKFDDQIDTDWSMFPYPVLLVPRKHLVKDRRRWDYGIADTGEVSISQWLDGDTLIGGQQYAKLYEQCDAGEPRLCGALRERQCDFGGIDSCVVYLYDFTLEKEYLLMRQGMFTADGYPDKADRQELYNLLTDSLQTCTIVKSKNISSADHTYRVMYLQTAEADTLRWVEGIGYEASGLLMGKDAQVYSLMSCYDGEVCIYTTIAEAQPPVPDGIVTLAQRTKSRKPFSSAFYDLQGRRLTGTPQHGVYVKDGRKYVVK